MSSGGGGPGARPSEEAAPGSELEPLVEPEPVGDRPFTGRRVPLTEPRSLLGPWVKVVLLVVALIGILVFHQTVSHQVVGCYQEVATAPGAGADGASGAENAAQPGSARPSGADAATSGAPGADATGATRPASPFANEVEIQLKPAPGR